MADKVLFPPGQIVATPGVLSMDIQPLEYLGRHLAGDWGELDPHDMRANKIALKDGYRLFSSYETPEGKIWIITEHDRSITTLLLPSEY